MKCDDNDGKTRSGWIVWCKTSGAIVGAAKVAQLNKTRKTEQIVCNLFRSMHVRPVFGVRIDVRDTFSGQNVRARAAPDERDHKTETKFSVFN